METGHEKVCTRCGTLNDQRTLVCVRCGESFEICEEKKYQKFKSKMINEMLVLFLFVILFFLYSFGMIFYIGPFFYDKLLWLGEKYIFNLFENLEMIYLSLEIIYTLILGLVNYISTVIILNSAMGSKLMKKGKANVTCIAIYIFMILCFALMIIYKHRFNYVIIIEYFMSLVVTFPYIKRQIVKRSI